MSLSARLTVTNPMARLARHKHPKLHGSNCFCSFSQNPVLSATYIKAIAPLMIAGARVCCLVRTADSLPWPEIFKSQTSQREGLLKSGSHLEQRLYKPAKVLRELLILGQLNGEQKARDSDYSTSC